MVEEEVVPVEVEVHLEEAVEVGVVEVHPLELIIVSLYLDYQNQAVGKI